VVFPKRSAEGRKVRRSALLRQRMRPEGIQARNHLPAMPNCSRCGRRGYQVTNRRASQIEAAIYLGVLSLAVITMVCAWRFA